MSKPKTKIVKERDYEFEITVKWSQSMPATSKAEAKRMIIESFYEEYGINLDEGEIKYLKPVKQ